MVTREWGLSVYTPGPLPMRQREANAHHAAAIRNPAKREQHELAAQILSDDLQAEGISPSAPSWEEEGKRLCAGGGAYINTFEGFTK